MQVLYRNLEALFITKSRKCGRREPILHTACACATFTQIYVIAGNIEEMYVYSLGSHKMKGAVLMLFTVATRTRPVFHNTPDVL